MSKLIARPPHGPQACSRTSAAGVAVWRAVSKPSAQIAGVYYQINERDAGDSEHEHAGQVAALVVDFGGDICDMRPAAVGVEDEHKCEAEIGGRGAYNLCFRRRLNRTCV